MKVNMNMNMNMNVNEKVNMNKNVNMNMNMNKKMKVSENAKMKVSKNAKVKVFHFLMTFFFFVSTTICTNPEMPLCFFVKAFTKFRPLMVTPDTTQDGNVQHFTYELYDDEEFMPTEFTFNGRQASVSSEHPFTGNVSIFEDYLTVHSTEKPLDLTWNRNMKIMNAQFYSCSDSTHTSRFIMVKRGFHSCYEVDIYVLPYDYHSRKAVPPVPPHLPMALFVGDGESFEPLSSINLGGDFNWSSIFTHNYPQASPVRIWYVDHMAHIYPSKYFLEWVGFEQGMVVHGHTVNRTTIFLDSSWRVIHWPFYSCALKPGVPNSVRAISSVIPDNSTSDCVEVHLYLLPYRRIKGDEPKGTPTSIEYLYEEDYVKPNFRSLRAHGNAPLERPNEDFIEEKKANDDFHYYDDIDDHDDDDDYWR